MFKKNQGWFIIKNVTNYALISPLINIPKNLLYRIPSSESKLDIGSLVVVSVKKRLCLGFVIELIDGIPQELENKPLEEIYQVLPFQPFFDKRLMRFYQFVASYYNVSLGMVLKAAFPDLGGIKILEKIKIPEKKEGNKSLIKNFLTKPTKKEIEKLKKLGIIESRKEIIIKDKKLSPIDYYDIREDKNVLFTKEQQRIKEKVLETLNKPERHLLFGKTASGKTELLLEIAKEVVNAGQSVFYLVPEISLVPHIYKRAVALLNQSSIFIWHSSIAKSTRWQTLLNIIDEPSLLIGTRSAIFLPALNVGLIIVDEEHDGSYKQEGQFCYNGRDMAVMRAKMLSHPVILSSATPSIETFYNAKSGNIHLHRLTKRFSPKSVEITVVNTKEEKLIEGFLSSNLVDALKENLEKGEQSMIFINRRGYIPYLYCEICKKIIECKNCTVSLTWHREKNLLICHHCGKTYKTINVCPYCKKPFISFLGAGTERIKEIVERLYPEAQVLKIDRDDIESPNFLKRQLKSIIDGSYNVLIATQIMAKGHHLPSLTLVGVLLGEQGLSLPDFRAQEKTFQILSQVFGRAGREKEGRVIIQTSFPEAPAISFALKDDYEGFYDYEIKTRREVLFPPFTRLLVIKIAAKDEELTRETAEKIFKRIKERGQKDIIIYPPQPAPIYKEALRYRYQIYVKAKKHQELINLVRLLQKEIGKDRKVIIYYDIDPVHMM